MEGLGGEASPYSRSSDKQRIGRSLAKMSELPLLSNKTRKLYIVISLLFALITQCSLHGTTLRYSSVCSPTSSEHTATQTLLNIDYMYVRFVTVSWAQRQNSLFPVLDTQMNAAVVSQPR